MRHKRAQGQRAGNIPFGYRLAQDGRALEPEHAEQTAISEIHRLRRGGNSLRRIATLLNDQGLRTRRGTAWRLESVVRITNQSAQGAL